ncbi:YDG domain-containing protein [Rhodanobacter sp. Col0626]|uniref:YDG domain-containing protein n=1 Tax=Rhodanobacter sp. Col0626 TaxID=3415679 RepID=UPI003CE8D577
MNHVYRTVFNRALGVWQVASEIASSHGKSHSGGHGKSGGRRLILLLLPLSAWISLACAADLPTGGTVSAGSGRISQSGAGMTIAQQSQNLAINWQSFDIGRDASVTFVQPNSSAIALNRVLGTNGTQILGQLKANGQVWVLNPNGVLFGSGAQVSVGGLVASTLGLSDADFLAGKHHFTGNGGTVTNEGHISAGYVALLGEQVKNGGVIAARLGTAALAAGNQVTLDFAGDQLLSVQVDEGALRALADNKGLIQADGGTVLMTARAKDALLDTAVNNTGVIQARTVGHQDGRILLLGDMDSGTVDVAGTLDASAPDGGNGGFIDTSAAHVKIANDVHVTTKADSGSNGTWLIDPVDFTVAASGGDMTGAAVSNALANGNFIIQSTTGGSGTAGDINVNDAVSWHANTLTLDAQNNINIRAPMNGSGTAGLALEYGQANSAAGNTSTYNINAPVNLAATGSFSTKLGSDGSAIGYTIITSLGAAGSTTGTDLQGMEGNWGRNYVLGADIDASATAGWNGGAGFMPIAQSDVPNDQRYFSGRFDGLGHVIDRLTVNRPDSVNIGLFGAIRDTTIANIGLTNTSILGRFYVGGLAGRTGNLTVGNSYTTGAVTGISDVGGLVGADIYPRASDVLRHVYSSADVTATYAGTGNGSNSGGAGGLIATGGNIQDSYATGTVTGGNYVGGLAAKMSYGSVSNSYFAGTVVVNGIPYAAGAIIGGSFGAGSTNTLTNVYWNTDTVGAGISSVGYASPNETNVAGLTTAQMRDAANWAGFTFTTTPGNSGWVLVDSDSGLNGSNGTVLPMLASEWSSVVRNAHQLQLMELDKSASYTLANDIDASATDGSSSAGAHDVWMGSSFAPIGGWGRFGGNFDGLGHKIDRLTINRPDTDYVGLFGAISNSRLINVGLTNVTIIGNSDVGGLVGLATASIIDNAYVEGGTVSGATLSSQNRDVGGLAGGFSGTIDHSHATVDVSGYGLVGGLVGQLGRFNDSGGFTSYLRNSYATGKVNAKTTGGGLAGATAAYLYNVYATGDVAGGGYYAGAYLGGLIGEMTAPDVADASNSSYLFGAYATGNVTSTEANAKGSYVGGLVGWAVCSYCGLDSVFATGNVTGSFNVGGLFGDVSGTTIIIRNAYAKDGTVTGVYAVGGLIGQVEQSVALYNVWAANGLLTSTEDNSRAGGLVGSANRIDGLLGLEINGVWNKDTSGAQYLWGKNHFFDEGSNSTQGAATTAQMMQKAVYEDPYNNFYMDGPFWGGVAILTDGTATTAYDPTGNPSFNAFRMYEGKTYPLLRFFLTPLVVSATPDYDGSGAAMGNIGSATFTNAPSGAHILGTGSVIQGSTLTLGSTQDGSYTATTDSRVTGLYTDSQFGYDFITGSSIRTISTPGSTAGEVQLPTSVTWSSGTLVIDTQGAITTVGANGANNTAIDGPALWLNHGTWRQNSSTLAGFSVSDFRLGNGNFLRAIGGNGDEDDPYRLTDLYGLQGMASADYLGNSFVLVNDIAAGATAGWNGGAGFVPVGNGTTAFTGNFDGAGHTISDLRISRSGANYVGLFGQAVGGSLGNVTLGNANVQGGENVGMFAGGIGSGTVIKNVQVDGTITVNQSIGGGGGNIGGGLVGSSNGRIIDSRASGTVTVDGAHAGGLVGWSDGTGISGSSADVTVHGGIYVGGLAGEADDAVDDSYATGTVTAQGQNFAYLDSYAGGLIGYAGAAAAVSNSYATGSVTVSHGSKVGGLIGEAHAAITDSYATGAVSGYAYVGGLVGATTAVIADSHATGAVQGSSTNGGKEDPVPNASACISTGPGCVGGLAGNSSADITNSYATGNVTGTAVGPLPGTTTRAPDAQYIGGLVGWQEDGTISNSFAIGDVKGFRYAGGLVGWANATIANTYATGDVTSSDFYSYSGGLVGYLSNGAVTTSYATGAVANTSGAPNDFNYLGGLVGVFDIESGVPTGSVSDSFFATTDADGNAINTGLSGNTHGTGKTLAELRQAATFAGWDMSANGGSGAVWRIYEGDTSPLLRSFMTAVTVSADPSGGKTYDGNIASGGYTTSVPVDPSLLLGSLSYSTNGADAGTYRTADGSLHVVGSLHSGQFGYDIAYSGDNELTIAKADATVTANSTTVGYDGQAQSVSGYTVTGLVNDETASVLDSLSESGGAGTNASSYAHTVGGSDNNYNLIFVEGSLTIDKASLTVSTGDVSKTYDGSTDADGALVITGGQLFGDDTLGGGRFAFTDKNAGTGKTVTVSGATLDDGNGGGNYDIHYTDNTGSSIDQKALTISGTTAAGKTYDGTTTAGITAGTLDGLVGSETLGVTASGDFDSRNAGSRTATAHYALADGGNDSLASNYTLADTSGHAATIAKAALAVGTGNVSKTYDGTTSANGTATVIGGTLFGNDALDGGHFAFTEKNAGTGKTVTVAGVTVDDGNSGGNYDVSYINNTDSTIDQKVLAINGTLANDKTYDGTTTAGITAGTLNGLVGSETLGVTATGDFDSRNAGSRTATAHYALGDGGNGGLAANYTLADTSGHAATIDKASLTVSTSDVSKTYDGNTDADGTLVITGGQLFGDDALGGGHFAFTDKNAGTGKTVAVSGATLDDGNHGDNYNIDYANNTRSSIDKKMLAISGTIAAGKTYDGTATADITSGALTGLVDDETLEVAATGEFDSKNAGDRTAIAHYTLGDGGNGGLASNYTLADTTGHAATIAKAALTVGTGNVSKTYDGTTGANGTATVIGGTLFGNDALDGGHFAFADKNAGTNKTVTVAGVKVDDGNGGGNYDVTYAANTASTIDRALLAITGSFGAASKLHDGTTDASIDRNALGLDGIIAGDSVAANWDATFNDAAVGKGKTVTLDGTLLAGDDNMNYVLSLAGAPTATADILQFAVPAVQGEGYAGATASAHASDTALALLPARKADPASGLPDLVVLQCGQNLPALLTKDCR